MVDNLKKPIHPSCFHLKDSTSSTLAKVTNDIVKYVKEVDSSYVTYLLLLEFSRTFNVFDHNLLVAKLIVYSVDGCLLR